MYVQAEIDIAAPPELVWHVLTDFEAYPDWNPFVRRLEGELALGARLRATIGFPGAKPMTFRTRVIRFEPGHGFQWRGRLLAPGVLTGEHGFRVKPLADGARTHFAQYERFGGVLVPLVGRKIARQTEAAFDAMNGALKERAEARRQRGVTTTHLTHEHQRLAR